ncbi:hypothetical protein RCL1_001369 [Eukaryota sp. TZLM3-RCL]
MDPLIKPSEDPVDELQTPTQFLDAALSRYSSLSSTHVLYFLLQQKFPTFLPHTPKIQFFSHNTFDKFKKSDLLTILETLHFHAKSSVPQVKWTKASLIIDILNFFPAPESSLVVLKSLIKSPVSLEIEDTPPSVFLYAEDTSMDSNALDYEHDKRGTWSVCLISIADKRRTLCEQCISSPVRSYSPLFPIPIQCTGLDKKFSFNVLKFIKSMAKGKCDIQLVWDSFPQNVQSKVIEQKSIVFEEMIADITNQEDYVSNGVLSPDLSSDIL